MTQQVKFSVCIPAYKSKYLEDCILSILNQSHHDWELVLLNDCSPEPVEAIVDRFDDPRIRYFKNETNVGAVDLVHNWNKCLDLARGEYIMIMGDDDLLDPKYLEEFSKLILAYPQVEVYHCRSKIIDDDGETVMLTPSCPTFESVYDSIWHRLRQLRSNYISDYVYRSDSLKARGGFYYLPLAWGSDDITAFIASAEKGIAHSNKPVFQYRDNRLSITSTGNDLEKMNANLGYAEWLKNFLTNTPSDPEAKIVHGHLASQQKHYMRQRKIFTMAKSMVSNPLQKSLLWLKHRERYGLTVQDIVLAMAKGIKMKASIRKV
ncbi:MAG TPA: glycosyltransferase [Cyclobacteriaceae bacterium]|nr:glycosyltransferase [Cyclobacteriaceae bacterium]